MTRVFLIRHGEPQAAWGGAVDDPGLSQAGQAQAAGAARSLLTLGPLAIVSSPMRRCRETAAPYESETASPALVERRVGEVVAPAGVSDRRAWLRENFPWDAGAPRRRWRDVDPALRAWRDDVVGCALAFNQDTAVFSHFIAINALASVAMQSEETIVCVPGYASITEFEVRNGSLELVRLGESMIRGEVR
ncbi:MAG: phosphoglycerate mutase family protein [Hyphomonadaceae bacterium]|nr:phosphoglycerate mutase family protein [Hyphomonadaceae bacterium]